MIWCFPARLVRVIDGDTVVLDLDQGFYQWRLGRSYRLSRIDAPELPTPLGQAAKHALSALLGPGGTLVAQTLKSDNFGRFIIELWLDGKNVSDAMVEAGHAAYRSY